MFGAPGQNQHVESPPTREVLLPRSAGMSVSCLEDSSFPHTWILLGVSTLCSRPSRPRGTCVIPWPCWSNR